jgi:transmembrane serine protease 8
VLSKVSLPIFDQEMCKKKFEDEREVTDGMICAGGQEGKDSCIGDSGGPFQCFLDGKWTIIGITSWGIQCGEDGYPGVYTRVPYFIDWIENELQNIKERIEK